MTRDEYEKLIDQIQGEVDEHDRRRMDAVFLLLEGGREQIVRRLRDAGDFEVVFLRSLRAEISTILDSMRSQIAGEIAAQASNIAEDATAQIARPAVAAGLNVRFGAIPHSLLDAYSGFTTNLISGASEEAQAKIAIEVGNAAVGLKTRAEAIGDIGENLSGKGIFPSLMHRAEAILETEMGRLNAQARQLRMREASAIEPALKKWWHDAGDARVRASHRIAAATYTPDRAIDIDAKFRVGGFDAEYPRDFSLPAGESVRCRCNAIMELPEKYFEEE